ncbi:hypothetical protein VB773_12600 [Haloarculaceae archaeon H-GB2-1]|nr:hypothetical protein [Haloarculaceae archaeon H-GB2-1]
MQEECRLGTGREEVGPVLRCDIACVVDDAAVAGQRLRVGDGEDEGSWVGPETTTSSRSSALDSTVTVSNAVSWVARYSSSPVARRLAAAEVVSERPGSALPTADHSLGRAMANASHAC